MSPLACARLEVGNNVISMHFTTYIRTTYMSIEINRQSSVSGHFEVFLVFLVVKNVKSEIRLSKKMAERT